MRGFWDRVAGLYDLAELLNRRANLAMKRETALWVPPGSRVLDCAAGTGALSLAAARRAGYVLCTDLSPDMLARAKGKGERAGLMNMEFSRRDIFAPPPEEPFDVVIAGNVLHLLEEPRRAVNCLLSCVRPGGRVILPTYLQGEAGAGFRAAIGAYQALGFLFQERYTLEGYGVLLESGGGGALLKAAGGAAAGGLRGIGKALKKEIFGL